MLVGILSDSHGDHRAVRMAMKCFDQNGVEYIIHCGDVGGAAVFDELVGRACTFVWGNTDCVDAGLEAYLRTGGLSIPVSTPTCLELDGRSFAVFHGHEPGFMAAPDAMDVDYLLHGHTHVARDERVGQTRVINPGALHRARKTTVAVLDTAVDQLVFHTIDV